MTSAPVERTQPAPTPAASRTVGARLRSAWGSIWGRLFRLLLAVLPLAWLARRVDPAAVLAQAAHVGPRGLALALLGSFASVALGSVRWGVMLRAYGADPAQVPGFLTLLRYNLIGQYFAVLPTGVAGEAVRGLRVAHCLPRASDSYVIVFIERAVGLLGLLAVAGLAAVLSPGTLTGAPALAMNVALAGALVFGCGVLALPQLAARFPRLRALLGRIPFAGPLLARLPAASGPSGLIVALALSALSQLGLVLSVAALLAPLAPAATVSACARIVPAIILVTYVPLTPGGFGQREVAFQRFFALVGVAREPALAASLLFFAVMLAVSLLGGVVLLFERARRAP